MGTAFQVYDGVWVLIVPEGEISVAFPRASPTLNDIPVLHGPSPALFLVWIHQVAEPEARAVDGVTEQVPVPEAQPACAEVYHVLILPVPLLSSTHSQYQVELGTAFQVYDGVSVLTFPEGEINVAFPGGGSLPTTKDIPLLHGPMS